MRCVRPAWTFRCNLCDATWWFKIMHRFVRHVINVGISSGALRDSTCASRRVSWREERISILFRERSHPFLEITTFGMFAYEQKCWICARCMRSDRGIRYLELCIDINTGRKFRYYKLETSLNSVRHESTWNSWDVLEQSRISRIGNSN